MPTTKVKFDFLKKEVIEEKVKAVMLGYQKLATSILPVNPEVILWDYLYLKDGVGLDDESYLGIDEKSGQQILGKTIPQKREIRIDASLKNQKARYNFTLAHEIGHWVLHSPLFQNNNDSRQMNFFENETIEFVSLNFHVFPKDSKFKLPSEEWQANQFAACLLIDSDLLKIEFIKRFGKESHDYRNLKEKGEIDGQFCSIREYSRYIAKTAVMGLQSLATLFCVSTETMAIRLEEVGIIYEFPKYSLFSF